jgi:choice-of-anchor A domain-containing protein
MPLLIEKSLRYLVSSITVLAGASLIALPARAGTVSLDSQLGISSQLNLLVFGNFSPTGADVEGQVAVGGNATIASGYTINLNNNTTTQPGAGLTVQGNLTYTGNGGGDTYRNVVVGGNFTSSGHGSIDNGNVYVGGNLNMSKGLSLGAGHVAEVWGNVTGEPRGTTNVTRMNGATQPFSLGFDFATVKGAADTLTAQLAHSQATGTVTSGNGGYILNASGKANEVFNLTAAQAASNLTIAGLASGASVVINVSGTSVDFGSHGYTIDFANGRSGDFSADAGKILFNLEQATTITGCCFDASLLAPYATVDSGWGNINGQVIVANWNSGIQVNNEPFSGTVPVPTEAPEPAGLPLLAGGILGLALLRRRALG